VAIAGPGVPFTGGLASAAAPGSERTAATTSEVWTRRFFMLKSIAFVCRNARPFLVAKNERRPDHIQAFLYRHANVT
jgi:hypothetical protein